MNTNGASKKRLMYFLKVYQALLVCEELGLLGIAVQLQGDNVGIKGAVCNFLKSLVISDTGGR